MLAKVHRGKKTKSMKAKSNIRFSTEPDNLETKQHKASFF